jgi:hypothetical protein
MSSVDSSQAKLGNEKTQPSPQQSTSTNVSSSTVPSTTPKTRLGLVPGENIKEKQVNIYILNFSQFFILIKTNIFLNLYSVDPGCSHFESIIRILSKPEMRINI